MKEYNKSSKLEHVAYDIRGPVLQEIQQNLALQRQTRSFMT